MKVGFPLLDKTVEIDEGARVSSACELAGAPLNLVCGGNGTCNKCRVDIIEHGEKKNVLGCQYPVSDGMEVLVEADWSKHQLLENSLTEQMALFPAVRCLQVDATKLKTPMGGYDFDTLRAVLGMPDLDVPYYPALMSLDASYRAGAAMLNVVVSENKIIDIVPSDEPIDFLGLAVDIGTTSVVAFIYDLRSGLLLGQASALNGQIAYGADVISRIEHTNQNPANRKVEQDAIAATINELIDSLAAEHGFDPHSIYEAVYCGNSTMQHLFLGLCARPLGRSPFTGVISQAVTVRGNELGVHINPRGHHIYMPLLGGFVGADTTACLLELPHDGKVRMMLDMGTNCEVAVGTKDRRLVASTACGPALEGAGLSMGMRGTTGAIERCTYEDGRFSVDVIGGDVPVGYCGSGIVDIVAALLKSGIVTGKGGFLKGKRLAEHPLAARVKVDEEHGRYFELLSEAENPGGPAIIVTLKDIRAIQLAKSAIYTGCVLLVRQYGIDPNQIEGICLAGAFGNYIDIPHAQEIGLIPQIEGVPVYSIGNGAGLGVQRCLLSKHELDRAETIRRKARHIELADDPDFTEVYLKSMSFEVNLMS